MPKTAAGNAGIFRWVAPVLLAAGCVLFFFGGPGYHAARSFQHLWNLGHIAFFALLTVTLSRWCRPDGNFYRQSAWFLATVLVVGIGVEVLQHPITRDVDPGDVGRNMLGCLIGLFFFLPARRSVPQRVITAAKILTLGATVIQAFPFVAATTDEVIARHRFPELAAFETPFEETRWTGNAGRTVDRETVYAGKAALRVDLGTEKYAGLNLKYFPGNWAGYRALEFSVHNPSEAPIKLTCRVHDRQHVRERQVYADRFNRSFRFSKGWTTIRIPMADIESAPADREMDLRRVHGLGLFAVRLPSPRTITLDEVRLRE